MKRLVLCLIVSISTLVIPNQSEAQNTFRVALLFDGDWERDDNLAEMLEKETIELIQGEFNVVFPDSLMIECEWDIDEMRRVYEQVQNDPNVDIVVAYGEFLSQLAIFSDIHIKPTIAPIAVNPDMHHYPVSEGTSGIDNLNYISFTTSLGNNVRKFRELQPFSEAVFLLNELYVDLAELKHSHHDEITDMKFNDVSISTVTAGGDIEKVLSQIPEGTEAVITLPLYNLRKDYVGSLIGRLLEKGIPTYSIFDEGLVGLGAIAGITPKDFFPRLSRRMALNIQRILLGENAGNIPVAFPIDEQLYINMQTVRNLSIYPDWSLMSSAKLLKDIKEDPGELITLQNAVEKAVTANLDLNTKRAEVRAGEEDVNSALSSLLPGVELSATGLLIDKDRAESSFGQQAERTLTGSLTLTQLLYNEKAWANLDIQNSLQKIRVLEKERLKLDIVKETASTYLNLLRAKSFENIAVENYQRSKENLEIARFRETVGYAGPQEVYRWESEIASNQKDVIEANANRNVLEISLNTLLNRPGEEPFRTESDILERLMNAIADKRVFKYYENKWYFKVFRDYLVSRAFEFSPEVQILNEAIVAKERESTSAMNSFILPAVSLQGRINDVLYRGGEGADGAAIEIPQQFGGGLLSFPVPKDVSWNIGLNLSLPLYMGGSRFAELAKSKIELYELEFEKKSVMEKIEQRLRSALHFSGASYAGMKEAEKSAESALKSLDLVVDAYTRGIVSIVELIDAQNAALIANQISANARYDFLIDIVNVQRALGRYLYSITSEERAEFFADLEKYFKENIKNF